MGFKFNFYSKNNLKTITEMSDDQKKEQKN
jgi:hypothetical protein